MLMPVIFPLHDAEPDNGIVHPAQRLIVPLVRHRFGERLNIDEIERGEFDVEMRDVRVTLRVCHERSPSGRFFILDPRSSSPARRRRKRPARLLLLVSAGERFASNLGLITFDITLWVARLLMPQTCRPGMSAPCPLMRREADSMCSPLSSSGCAPLRTFSARVGSSTPRAWKSSCLGGTASRAGCFLTVAH